MSESPVEPSGQGENAEPLPRFLESKPVKKAAPGSEGAGRKILLGALLLIFIGMVFQTFIFTKKTKALPAAKTGPAPLAGPPYVDQPQNNAPDLAEVEEDRSGARGSPFSMAAPVTAMPDASAPVQEPVLQGILMDAQGEAMAVMNEKIVKKGERLADNLIKEIRGDSVVLQKDSGEEWTLRMKSRSSKPGA